MSTPLQQAATITPVSLVAPDGAAKVPSLAQTEPATTNSNAAGISPHQALVQIGLELGLVVGLVVMAESGDNGWHISLVIMVALWVLFLINRLGK